MQVLQDAQPSSAAADAVHSDTDSFSLHPTTASFERSCVYFTRAGAIAEQLDVCRLSCPTQLSHERHCAFVEQ
jgi:hypothetical protein